MFFSNVMKQYNSMTMINDLISKAEIVWKTNWEKRTEKKIKCSTFFSTK